jgi:O-antigen/teichoic acid export membrane protein
MRMIPALRFRVHEIQWGRARELVAFGGWSLLGYIAYRLREATILFFLNRFATLADVTIFTFGYLGRRQIDQWMDVLGSSLYSVVTGMHALGAKERIRAIYLRGGRITLWLTLFFAMPAALYARPILRLYAGDACAEAAVVMIVTLAGLPITGGTWMVWQVANATGRVRSVNLYAFSLQVIVIPLVFWIVYTLRSEVSVGGLVPGCVGLMLLAVSVFPEVLILWPMGLKLAGATFPAWVRETLIPGLAPACVASLVWSILAVVVQPQSWMGLGLCVLAGALCYLIVLLGFCLEPRDREDLAHGIARIKNAAGWGLGVSKPVPIGAGPGPASGSVPVENQVG